MSVLVASVLAALLGAAAGQLTPGCSFNDGRCMYNVQLGHYGTCDTRRDVSTDGTQCCADLKGQVTAVTSDVNNLKTQVSTLLSELVATKQNVSEAGQALTEEQLKSQQLLQMLGEKQHELNQTQHELANVLGQAGEEIRKLREANDRLTSQVVACQGSSANVTTLPPSKFLTSVSLVRKCDFEGPTNASDTTGCSFTFSKPGPIKLGAKTLSSSTGPKMDHTIGAPKGHYLYLDAHQVGLDVYYHSSSYNSGPTSTYSATSPSLPPSAHGYCVQFWYNMYGHDIGTLKMFAKINGGKGYPVFSRSGALDQDWHLAEVDLDQEYTTHPIQLEFSMTSTAYHYSSSSSVRNTAGNIALDDLFVYNTSCTHVPKCPRNAITRQEGEMTTCYTFHVVPASWYDAAVDCRSLGANTSLATVTSQADQDFLVATIRASPELTGAGQYGYFVAGNDERAEHTFEWTNTGTPYTARYSNWKAGQPNNIGDDQDCLLLQYPDLDFQWGDVDCDERHPYVCMTQYTGTAPKSGSGIASASPMIG